MTTTEGNKLISEFMGALLHKDWTSPVYKIPADTFEFTITPTKHSSIHWLPEELQYHTSWDWLMPVVEKIEALGFNTWVKAHNCIINDSNAPYDVRVKVEYATNKIEAVWQAVVQFIQWFNESLSADGTIKTKQP